MCRILLWSAGDGAGNQTRSIVFSFSYSTLQSQYISSMDFCTRCLSLRISNKLWTLHNHQSNWTWFLEQSKLTNILWRRAVVISNLIYREGIDMHIRFIFHMWYNKRYAFLSTPMMLIVSCNYSTREIGDACCSVNKIVLTCPNQKYS